MNQAILTPEVQVFLHEHLSSVPASLALKKSPFAQVTSAELANQLEGLQRSRKKLPLWFDTPMIYFPSLLAMEQTSSALTAEYKSSLIPTDSTLIDLTGGFGVDSYYFSRVAKEVIHCELNEDLSQIAFHNAHVLQSRNIQFIASDGLAYLKERQHKAFDVIYIDPSRRVQQRKVFRLSDCEPNVVAASAFLLEKGGKIIIKAAPLLDIKAALMELHGVKEVHIISVQNECKELLFILAPNDLFPPTYHCVALTNGEKKIFTFSAEQEANSHPTYSKPLRYLYEPDAALLKAGCFRSIAVSYDLKKLHQHTHLYTADVLHTSFIGRIFEVISTSPYAEFKKQKTALTANVSSRNFPLKPEELKKKHRIKDGGHDYLFFCTAPDGALLVIQGRKLS